MDDALHEYFDGAATWTRPESTGRSPLDTIIVKRAESEATIDWSAANNIPLDEETFDMLVEDDAVQPLAPAPVILEPEPVAAAASEE